GGYSPALPDAVIGGHGAGGARRGRRAQRQGELTARGRELAKGVDGVVDEPLEGRLGPVVADRGEVVEELLALLRGVVPGGRQCLAECGEVLGAGGRRGHGPTSLAMATASIGGPVHSHGSRDHGPGVGVDVTPVTAG